MQHFYYTFKGTLVIDCPSTGQSQVQDLGLCVPGSFISQSTTLSCSSRVSANKDYSLHTIFTTETFTLSAKGGCTPSLQHPCSVSTVTAKATNKQKQSKASAGISYSPIKSLSLSVAHSVMWIIPFLKAHISMPYPSKGCVCPRVFYPEHRTQIQLLFD